MNTLRCTWCVYSRTRQKLPDMACPEKPIEPPGPKTVADHGLPPRSRDRDRRHAAQRGRRESAVPEPVRPSATAGGPTGCNALSVRPSACRSSRLAGPEAPSRTRRPRGRGRAWPSDTADGRARSTPGSTSRPTTSARPAARPGRPRKRHRCGEAWSTGARWLERHGGRAVRPQIPPTRDPVSAFDRGLAKPAKVWNSYTPTAYRSGTACPDGSTS